MTLKNVFYAQSGGPTAVINASACGVIETARAHKDRIGTVYAGHNGILGALQEELIDTSLESDKDIAGLKHTPSSAFGSCRYKLKNMEEDDSQYRRLIDVFAAHDIGYFFYNGGNDSQDTAYKVSQISEKLGYPLTCIGIPKTIDNDLPFTDFCPGFGSAAKYIAVSVKETARDLASMALTSTKVFILEVMGRHAGWLAAAAGLAEEQPGDAPHIILFPEVPFNHSAFLEKVTESVENHGHCVVVVSEGIRDEKGKFLHESDMQDAFGHEQLGGIAPILARYIKRELGYKNHCAVADYLQRSARHIASFNDVEQAYALGKAAIEFAVSGINNVMLTVERQKTAEVTWKIGTVPLERVANVEAKVPAEFIREDGLGITEACREYLQPLILGESYPPYENGLPAYVRLKKQCVAKKLGVTPEYL